ncbi:hypothetical protein ROA7450_03612 [Roseovarius albus]|uniref:Immunity MXAN-0049 protein domain-containing protein n=1 Tax=Roseovarius albus TaxID=1247867 RepID=A0A1X7A0W7_9RHOB|nr:DUF1629 domain-containing protein [Roseovarius albus]SLN67521.1 hypothetical protein ROA7450_03612 [Roseovarius albus]
MIYRPFVERERFDTGLWWSDNPYEEVSQANPRQTMNLDILLADPLTEKNKAFVARHWAVVSGEIDRLGDAFQGFDTRDIVVGGNVAQAIDKLEPGVHDLIPIPNVWSLGSQQRVERKFYFLNIYATTRTVIMEKSDTSGGIRKTDGKRWKSLSAIAPECCHVLAEAADGRHLWRDDLTRAVFMSDTLVRALNEAGVRGFEYMETTVITH